MTTVFLKIYFFLQVPRDAKKESRTDNDVSLHDQILWVLHKSGMEDLLLYVASTENEMQYSLHVLEIISLMFREQVILMRLAESTISYNLITKACNQSANLTLWWPF